MTEHRETAVTPPKVDSAIDTSTCPDCKWDGYIAWRHRPCEHKALFDDERDNHGEMDGTVIVPTREFCQRCHHLSPIGFHARNDIWVLVAGEHWRWSILCLTCFAALGDEKGIQWEVGMDFYPTSFFTLQEQRDKTLMERLAVADPVRRVRRWP